MYALPSICPSTSVGFRARPQSCAIQIFFTATIPVSGSTSTSATWAVKEYAGEAPSFDARKHRDTLRARGTAFRMADVSSTGSIVGPITLPPLRFAPELDPGHIYTLFVFVPGSGAEREVGAVVVPKLAAPDVVELWHLREGGSPAQDFISPSPESPSVALRLVAARSIDAQFDVKTFTPPFASRCLVLAGTETRYG